ncbi:hypothetical protein [Sporolactobacillus terrae]|uniref:hypothetical protein n=1 Tax=Sporolactobacillus terrae TaxID=269673 RepID=UPI000A9D5474|nr:hypothetical protein [Sporolactobacillus terrae]
MPLLSRFKEPEGMSKRQIVEVIDGMMARREQMQNDLDEIDAIIEDLEDELRLRGG